MSTAVVMGLELRTETCCVSECGITFAVPTTWQDKRRETHKTWWCPNGHKQHYAGETELEQAQKDLARLKRRAEYLEADRDTLERSRSSIRGHLTRVKQRVAAGVCPCCKRTFQNVARHMKTKHPDYGKVVA